MPVALIGTFAVMLALGFSLNTVSLLAMVLAIGIVVDDAIVVVEAVMHHIEHGMEPKEATVKAMGTGFAHGMWIRDVGITNDPRGRPLVIFSERGRGVCAELGIGAAHVSLTDDAGLVIAFAVVERAPGKG